MELKHLALVVLLAGCTPTTKGDTPAYRAADNTQDVAQKAVKETVDLGEKAAEPAEQAAGAVSTAITPAVVAVAEAVEVLLPPPELPPVVDARIINHIVRWEVSGERAYTAKWQGVICPGLASGPTWGIGYDGGHQTQSTIRTDWKHRHDTDVLASASGQTGAAKCAAAKTRMASVRVPFPEAMMVFGSSSYPVWQRVTDRAYPGADQLPPLARGALVGNTYNRGASMAGSRNAEKRIIRDTCVPAKDVQCVAAQFRASKRLWQDTPGVAARREDEARLAVTR